MRVADAVRRPVAAFCAMLGATATLGGCVDTAVELGSVRPEQVAQRRRPTPRPGVSPHGASVVLASLEGASEEVLARFRPIFARTAEARDIATAGEADAAYRLRGYLTSYAGSEGTPRLAYVFDVFDRDGRRARRLSDDVPASPDGSAVEDEALADLAARGADDLAAFLSNTPEAIAAAAGSESGVTIAEATRPAPEPPRGAATTQGFAEAR